MYVWNCFWVFHSILLVCLPLPEPVHISVMTSFTIQVWISSRASLSTLFLFLQNCLGYSWLFVLTPTHSLGMLKIIPLNLGCCSSVSPLLAFMLVLSCILLTRMLSLPQYNWLFLFRQSVVFYRDLSIRGEEATHLPCSYHFWHS